MPYNFLLDRFPDQLWAILCGRISRCRKLDCSVQRLGKSLQGSTSCKWYADACMLATNFMGWGFRSCLIFSSLDSLDKQNLFSEICIKFNDFVSVWRLRCGRAENMRGFSFYLQSVPGGLLVVLDRPSSSVCGKQRPCDVLLMDQIPQLRVTTVALDRSQGLERLVL